MRAAINVTREKSHVHTNVLQPKKEPRSRGAQAFDGTELPSVICCRRSHAARSPAAGWTLGCAARASAESCPGRWSRACSRPRCAATAHVAELRRPDRHSGRWSRALWRPPYAAPAPGAGLRHPDPHSGRWLRAPWFCCAGACCEPAPPWPVVDDWPAP